MTQTATRVRRLAAVTGTGALVASALMFAPANAAGTVTVRNADVKQTAADYTAWHQGYANNPTGAKVTPAGLELSGGPSQVIKGYTDNDATIGANKNFDLAAKITSSDFTTSKGTANLQVPLFAKNVTAADDFTTLRSLDDDGSRIKLTDEWASSREIVNGETVIPANTPTPLRDIIGALGDYKVIGFGVQSDTPATVTDITWDGTTYTFSEKAIASAKFYRFSPKSGKITTRSTVYMYVQVTLDGKPAPKGTLVEGYAKSKKIVSNTVNSEGKVRLKLGKLPKGKATLKATVVSTDGITGTSISRAVTVRR